MTHFGDEVLEIWQQAHGELSDKHRSVFLTRPEIRYLSLLDRSHVRAAVQQEMKLRDALRIAREAQARASAQARPDIASAQSEDPRLKSVKEVLVLLGELRSAELRADPQLLARWANDPATRRLMNYRVAMVRTVVAQLTISSPEELPEAVHRELQRRARLLPTQVLDGRNEDIGAPLYSAPTRGATTRSSLG